MNKNDGYTVRPLTAAELPMLTQLFDYNDVEDMLSENTRNLDEGTADIFGLFYGGRLVGELHAEYDCPDPLEAVRGRRVYLFAFRIHEDFRGLGLGKYLLRCVINILSEQGCSEFTVGVEDDNPRARHIYESFGFTETIARKREEYQGDSYEYDLLLRKNKPCRDFIFIIGASGVGKTTLAGRLYEHYRGALVEQNQAPEFIGFDGFEELGGLHEEEACFRWTISTLMCYHSLGIKNIVAADFDDLRTREFPELFKGFDYITVKLICGDYGQSCSRMKNRAGGLIDFELLESSSPKINSRPPLVNEFVIDTADKTAEEVFREAVSLIDTAETLRDYEYSMPPRGEFYSWVYANRLR